MNTTTDNATYVNEDSGEVTCAKHGGHTLRSSIAHAKAGQVVFRGINGERFILLPDNEFDCEYCL